MKYHTRSYEIRRLAIPVACVLPVLLLVVAWAILALRRNPTTDRQEAAPPSPSNSSPKDRLETKPGESGGAGATGLLSQPSAESKTNDVEDHFRQGKALADAGKTREAIPHFQRALQAKPNDIDARCCLANALRDIGCVGEAMAEYRTALETDSRCLNAMIELARLKATCSEKFLRNGGEAVTLAQEAVALSQGNDPVALEVLAAAYAETGRFPEAAKTARQALNLASAQNNAALVDVLVERIRLYTNTKPQ
jgi:Flp pilus assembly protein TadD